MNCGFSPLCFIKLFTVSAFLTCALALNIPQLLKTLHTEMNICEELQHCSSFWLLNRSLECKFTELVMRKDSTATTGHRDMQKNPRNSSIKGQQRSGRVLLATHSTRSRMSLHEFKVPEEEFVRLTRLNVWYTLAVVYVPYFQKLAISCLEPKRVVLAPLTKSGPIRTIYRRLAPSILTPGRDGQLFGVLPGKFAQTLYSLNGTSIFPMCATERREIFHAIAYDSKSDIVFIATNLYFQTYHFNSRNIKTVSRESYSSIYLNSDNQILYTAKQKQIFSIPIVKGYNPSLMSTLQYNVSKLYYSDGLLFAYGMKDVLHTVSFCIIEVHNRRLERIDLPNKFGKNMNMTMCRLYS